MALTFNPLTLATFNGSSKYAADLQQAITHAVNVAAIPLTQLGNNANQLNDQKTELGVLQDKITAIQTAVNNLSSASTGSLTGSVDDDSVASVAVDSSKALAGSFTLNVISAGSRTLTLSNAGSTVADPTTGSLSTASSFTLSVNGTNTTITPATNTLTALAQAINASGAGVTAAIVNLGSPSAPDYKLSVKGTSLHSDSIQLNDGSQDLLGTLSAGSEATYQIDGQPTTPISTTSSEVTIAPGVTVGLLHAGLTTVNVAPDPSAAENALSAFADAYNSAVSELTLNHGSGGGALTGQPIVAQLEQSLRGVLTFTGGSGSVSSLADVGLSFDSSGKLTFQAATFISAQNSNPTGVSDFLGSATSGFAASVTNTLNTFDDANTGLFRTTGDSYQKQIDADTNEINATETRITSMQANLVQQMSAADATLASLDSQLSFYTSLFQATQDAINNAK